MWPRFGPSPRPRAKARTRWSGPSSFPCLGVQPGGSAAAAEFVGFGGGGHKVALIPMGIVARHVERRLRDRRRSAKFVGGVGCKCLLFRHLCFAPREHGVERVANRTINPTAGRRLPPRHRTCPARRRDSPASWGHSRSPRQPLVPLHDGPGRHACWRNVRRRNPHELRRERLLAS